jgi:VanZ family protein
LTLYLLLKPGNVNETFRFFEHEDKVAHFVLFFGYTVLWLRYFLLEWKWPWKKAMLVVATLGVVLAALTEILQHFIPRRASDWVDFSVDLVGIAVGIILIFFRKKESISV